MPGHRYGYPPQSLALAIASRMHVCRAGAVPGRPSPNRLARRSTLDAQHCDSECVNSSFTAFGRQRRIRLRPSRRRSNADSKPILPPASSSVRRAPCHAATVEDSPTPLVLFYVPPTLARHARASQSAPRPSHAHRAEMSRHIAASSLRSGEPLAEVLSARTQAMVLR